jgi:hypothetical protein
MLIIKKIDRKNFPFGIFDEKQGEFLSMFESKKEAETALKNFNKKKNK